MHFEWEFEHVRDVFRGHDVIDQPVSMDYAILDERGVCHPGGNVLKLVRNEHRGRDVPFANRGRECLEHMLSCSEIECSGWLIEQQEFAFLEQGSSEFHFGAFTVRQR